jgi:hypothetical protein
LEKSKLQKATCSFSNQSIFNQNQPNKFLTFHHRQTTSFSVRKGKMIFFIVLVVLTALCAIFIGKYKLLTKIIVKRFTIPKGCLLYITYQGSYNKLMPTINKVKQDLGDSSPLFGIYYDDPSKCLDQSKCRAIVGVLLESKPDFIVPEGYKTQEFGAVEAFGALFPLFGLQNIIFAIIRGYPVIKSFGIREGLLNQSLCSMEIYNYPSHQLTICFPFGESSKPLLYLSGYEQPEYKQ